jgi:dynein heavy chain 1
MSEQSPGIRDNMKDPLSALPTKGTKPPIERTRVYLLLAVVRKWQWYASSLGLVILAHSRRVKQFQVC